MASSRSVEALQDRTYGGFQSALRAGTSTEDAISKSIEAGKKNKLRRKQFENTEKIHHKNGTFSKAQFEDILKKQDEKQAIKLQKMKTAIEYRDRHFMILKAIDIFEKDFFMNEEITAELLESTEGIVKTEHVLVENKEFIVKLEIDKILSSTLRCFLDITHNKSVFVKAPDFEVTKRTVKGIKVIKERVKFNAKLGDIFEFRKTFLAPVTTQIKAYGISDDNQNEKDIWAF